MEKLRQIQLCELDILKQLHNICENNNIEYSMAYGTMLGAVRHQGFIPWDDDLDVYIKLSDIPKIEKLIPDELFFQTEKTDPESLYVYCKLRKNNTYMDEPIVSTLNIHKGVWIDLFPYVDAAKTEVGKSIQFWLCRILQQFKLKYIRLNGVNKYIKKYLCSISIIIEKLLVFLICSIGSKKSNEYFIFIRSSKKTHFDNKEFLDNKSKYFFEGLGFYGPEDYNGYLTKVFGDNYMIPQQWGSHIKNYDDVIL